MRILSSHSRSLSLSLSHPPSTAPHRDDLHAAVADEVCVDLTYNLVNGLSAQSGCVQCLSPRLRIGWKCGDSFRDGPERILAATLNKEACEPSNECGAHGTDILRAQTCEERSAVMHRWSRWTKTETLRPEVRPDGVARVHRAG